MTIFQHPKRLNTIYSKCLYNGIPTTIEHVQSFILTNTHYSNSGVLSYTKVYYIKRQLTVPRSSGWNKTTYNTDILYHD